MYLYSLAGVYCTVAALVVRDTKFYFKNLKHTVGQLRPGLAVANLNEFGLDADQVAVRDKDGFKLSFSTPIMSELLFNFPRGFHLSIVVNATISESYACPY